MIAYLDASVILRRILGEPDGLKEWTRIDGAVASALTEVECLRTLDRLMRKDLLSAEELAERRAGVYQLMEAIEIVEVSRPILRRAAEPFPTPIGTLDALHLATALAWRDARGVAPMMATHDRGLATAARSVGLEVIGV